MYAATSERACFVETLLRGPNMFVAQAELETRSFCRLRALRDIRLVRLFGPSMVGIGATGVVASSPDYGLSQRWSQALHAHNDAPDGILYRSNYDNDEFAVVLFDRAASAIDNGTSTPVMSDLALLGAILNRYKASIR
jgi:hypothetical protein